MTVFGNGRRILSWELVALKRAVGKVNSATRSLLAAGVFGDSFGSLADGVFSQLAGQKETDSSLDLPRSDGRSLVVVSEAGSFSGDSLEDIVDKAVHDGHSFAADTGVGVHLLQHLVDVDAVTFLPPPLSLLVSGTGGLCLTSLLGTFRANLGWHDDSVF